MKGRLSDVSLRRVELDENCGAIDGLSLLKADSEA